MQVEHVYIACAERSSIYVRNQYLMQTTQLFSQNGERDILGSSTYYQFKVLHTC